jgi:hypothetical protein
MNKFWKEKKRENKRRDRDKVTLTFPKKSRE